VVEIFKNKQTISIITSQGRNGRIIADDIKEINYSKENNRMMNLNKDELIKDVIILIENNE